MSTDRGLEATRHAREAISREHGNEPRRLIDHYLEYQERFADRLRREPGPGHSARDASDQGDSPDPPR
jgi:hypothetical protein